MDSGLPPPFFFPSVVILDQTLGWDRGYGVGYLSKQKAESTMDPHPSLLMGSHPTEGTGQTSPVLIQSRIVTGLG